MEQLAAFDPRELGLYRPRAVLGEGGMGRVLLATGADGALVAIKRVHAHLAADDGFRRRFRREVAATRKVAVDHIAPLVHADLDADVPWLASEFVHGPALRVVLEEAGGLPQDAVLRLANGLAAALRDIHAAGLVHRDLSPSNVQRRRTLSQSPLHRVPPWPRAPLPPLWRRRTAASPPRRSRRQDR
ncbi:hypothetical protein E1265_23095 [Streptomyces sp. 8K308]|nr:hypothetical protein E1265_23095 [Streptomyces sp. 8K308]